MKAQDITILTTELKSSNNVRYRNKIFYFICHFRGHDYQKHIHRVKVIYHMRIVGCRQVTVRFMNLKKLLNQSSSFKVIQNYTDD